MADDEGKNYLYEAEVQQKKTRTRVVIVASVVFALLGVAGVVGGVVYTVTDRSTASNSNQPQRCPLPADSCSFTLVESIPDNLTFAAGSPVHPSTFSGIHQMLGMAQETIEIASYYWTLRSSDIATKDPSSWAGDQLFKDLVTAGRDKGIKIRIVQSQSKDPIQDTLDLQAQAGAEVRSLNFVRLIGSGILHTKLWIIDRKHFYLGSANLDWRSFTQVKEMGAVIQQCPCLAQDLGKIFDAYWYLATPTSTIPSSWPQDYNTVYNDIFPMKVNFNGTSFDTFLSSSPPQICPAGRAGDGNTIVEIINSADKYIHIAVMDYFPTTQFNHPRKYWPVIDDALRSAAFNRHVGVKLLFSYWKHTWDDMFAYMRSLQALKFSSKYVHIDIQVKAFIVPAYTDAQKNIPYGRVNHNKYMVTDKTAYIGTSNWSGDYFLVTGGIGLVTSKTAGQGNGTVDIRQQLEDVFNRDWYSAHAFSLDHFNQTMFS